MTAPIQAGNRLALAVWDALAAGPGSADNDALRSVANEFLFGGKFDCPLYPFARDLTFAVHE